MERPIHVSLYLQLGVKRDSIMVVCAGLPELVCLPPFESAERGLRERRGKTSCEPWDSNLSQF